MPWQRPDEPTRLHALSSDELVACILSNAGLTEPVLPEPARLARAIDGVVDRLENDGRLFLAAAGGSAHLVEYAASESARWFDTGDVIDLLTAPSGESDESAIEKVDRRVTPDDAIVCVSRSGQNPWTVAAARKANLCGALTIATSCEPGSPLLRECDFPVVLKPGPELVMGYTTQNAGSAVKTLLDILLLAVAVGTRRVWADVPVLADIEPADAWRIVEAAAGVTHLEARSTIAAADGNVRTAIVMAKFGVDKAAAEAKLAEGQLVELLG